MDKKIQICVFLLSVICFMFKRGQLKLTKYQLNYVN